MPVTFVMSKCVPDISHHFLPCSPQNLVLRLDPATYTASDISTGILKDTSGQGNDLTITGAITLSSQNGGSLSFIPANAAYARRASLNVPGGTFGSTWTGGLTWPTSCTLRVLGSVCKSTVLLHHESPPQKFAGVVWFNPTLAYVTTGTSPRLMTLNRSPANVANEML